MAKLQEGMKERFVLYINTEARIHDLNPFEIKNGVDGNKVYETIPVHLLPGINSVPEAVSKLLEGEFENSVGEKEYICREFIDILGGVIKKVAVVEDINNVRTKDIKVPSEACELIRGALFLELLDTIVIGETRNGVLEAAKQQREKIIHRLNLIKKANAA